MREMNRSPKIFCLDLQIPKNHIKLLYLVSITLKGFWQSLLDPVKVHSIRIVATKQFRK